MANLLTLRIDYLMCANRLAAERYNGKRLRDLSAIDQDALIADATAIVEHYIERKS